MRQAVIGLCRARPRLTRRMRRYALRTSQRMPNARSSHSASPTPYDVILRERDLVSARQADMTASATYAKALVEFERATGTTLEKNGIALSDAQYGRGGLGSGAVSDSPESRNRQR